MRALAALILVLLALVVAQAVVYFPQLPEPMASHFGGSGVADGWSSRASFFTLSGLVIGFVTLLVGGLILLLPKMPDHTFNMPHRELWLAPGRRAATLAVVQRTLGWILVVTLAFVLFTLQLVIDANLNPPPRLAPAFLWGLGGFLAVVFFFAGRLYLRFREPPPGPG